MKKVFSIFAFVSVCSLALITIGCQKEETATPQPISAEEAAEQIDTLEKEVAVPAQTETQKPKDHPAH